MGDEDDPLLKLCYINDSSDEDQDFGRSSSGASSSTIEEANPAYVRLPGYLYHGHHQALCSPEPTLLSTSVKKKDLNKAFLKDAHCKLQPITHYKSHHCAKQRLKKGPVPMKLRALPVSFWQQPNNTVDVSPGNIYPVLPPLISKDTTEVELRPVTPQLPDNQSGCGLTKIKVGNSELLLKLFEKYEDDTPRATGGKRGRPKKIPHQPHSLRFNEDPCMLYEPLHPIKPLGICNKTFPEGKMSAKATVDQNYSQLLTDLVVKL